MTIRTPLPKRRPCETIETEWDGHPFTVTLGLDPVAGAVREVFADTAKGGQMQATLADACIVISIALQHGIPAAALAKSLSEVPDPTPGGETDLPGSPIGTILAVIKTQSEIKGRPDHGQ